MIVLQIVMCILLAAVFVYWARFFVIHWKAKAHFRRCLPEDDKAVIDYRWHRTPLFPDVLWWKKEHAFIRKRNEVLLEFDRERAERLIAAERKMCISEYLFQLLLSLWIVTLFAVGFYDLMRGGTEWYR
jgi:hypothetical protein